MLRASNDDGFRPSLVWVNGVWSDPAPAPLRRLDQPAQDFAARATPHGRAVAILVIVYRALIVCGVLAALECAI